MNDLQEVILDRLMAADKIGAGWNSGPLNLALQALRRKKLIHKGDATRALGFPMVLCEAIQGASVALPNADERRRLAVTLFTEVPPRPRAPKLSWRRHLEVGMWCARRVHLLECTADCPYLLAVERWLADCLADPRGKRGQPAVDCGCRAVRRLEPAEGGGYGSTPYQVLRALRKVIWVAKTVAWVGRSGLSPGSVGNYTAKIGRGAARLFALKGGSKGATDFCLALAKELGLTR